MSILQSISHYKTINPYKTIETTLPGPSRNACGTLVYTIWSPSRALLSYHRRVIEAAKHLQLNIIVVINNPALDHSSLCYLRDAVNLIILRPNLGRDISAYRDAIIEITTRFGDDESLSSKIILLNDSMYSLSIDSVRDVLARLLRSDKCFCALTESYDQMYHLQSHCWSFSYSLLRNGFMEYWLTVLDITDGQMIVDLYEVRILAWLAKLIDIQLDLEVLYPISLLMSNSTFLERTRIISELYPLGIETMTSHHHNITSADQRLNPTHQLFLELLVTGFPFLKRDLLTENRTRVPHVWAYTNILEAIGYDSDIMHSIRIDLAKHQSS